MKNHLPIYGQIPTSFKCKEVIDSSDDPDVDIFAVIDTPQIIEKQNYPPRPMEFTISTYSPREKKLALTYCEFYTKLFFMTPDAPFVIVRYDEQSKLFHVDPTEVVSLINVSDTGSSIVFYSMWYKEAKLIKFGQLQSATITDDNGDFCLLVNDNGETRIIPPNTSLYLNGKVNTNCPIIDVVHFSGLTICSNERKPYIGLLVP